MSDVGAAKADVSFGMRVAVGPAPAAAPMADCSGVKTLRFATYGAQIVNVAVVSNAVRQGSTAATFFGAHHGFATYIGQFALEDALAGLLTRHASCKVKAGVQFVLGASALVNAAKTEFPR